MAIYKTFNDLIVSMIEYLRLLQPELDTKPGAVARDVFVDSPSQQMANLYTQIKTIAGLQSMFSATGSDLNRLGSNFGATRASGSSSTGVVVFTTNNMEVDVLIPEGSVVTARNGVNFETLEDVVMRSTSANVYRATATRLRSDLDLASITDEYALEVTVQALTTGLSGNVGRFSVTSHNIGGVSNVTNLSSFSGGSNSESDDEFRTRILSIFAGSNTGTSLGYKTAIEVVSGVLDSEIVVPGDPLLIRDGTQVVTDTDGSLIVSEPGNGGKVDIYVLGEDLESQIDSFIYNDQSGTDDPTDPDNDYILGQKGADVTLNAAQRRVTLINADDLPYQPVSSITNVAGSSSGSNFVEKYVDSQGRTHGNYELVKDTGDFGGSPFGFDKLKWISGLVEIDSEDVTKGIFNGVDELDYSDVDEINGITQDYLVTNENSTTSSTDRSSVNLKHKPIRSVSRVVNLTTGERYVIEDQNPDGESGGLNTTGKITISGSTLPVGTDTLQVDYTWVKSFDSKLDFDNLKDYNGIRTVQDSVDWGFCNLVRNEPATVEDAYGVLTVDVSHPIHKVLSVNSFDTYSTTVNDGIVTANKNIINVIDIRRVSDGVELFNTDARGGTLFGTTSVALPDDSIAEDGDAVIIRFNATDVFAPDGYEEGSFENETISLTTGTSYNEASVLVNYVANVSTLISETDIGSLPITKNGNKFVINGEDAGEQPTSNILDGNGDFTNNIRRAAAHLRVTMTSTPAEGSITLAGITMKKVTDALITVTSSSGYDVDVQSAIASDLGTSVGSSIKIVRLLSFERVIANRSSVVTSVDNVYDIVNYTIKDNSYDLGVALKSSSLSRTKLLIPQTTDNVAARLETGDVVRVSFYYINESDYERLYYSKDGTHITDKSFVDVSRISVSSGFKGADGVLRGAFAMQNSNQPTSNTTYDVEYTFEGPKENERITVTFNQNALINIATNSIESVRPVTADILVKEAISVAINVSIKIVLLPEYVNQEQTVKQDAADAVSSFLSATSLGTTVDSSDVINTLYSVSGIDRVRIINFSTGTGGNLLSITAERNEYLDAGTITVEVEER